MEIDAVEKAAVDQGGPPKVVPMKFVLHTRRLNDSSRRWSEAP